MKVIRTLILCLVGVAVLGATVAPAHATHFRFGTVSWRPRTDISPTTVEFTVTAGWDRTEYSGSGPDGLPIAGDVINENIGGTTVNFGDGNSVTPVFEVIAHNIKQEWMITKAEMPGLADKIILHTYDPNSFFPQPWIAGIDSCCRISPGDHHINNPDDGYTVQTKVDLTGNTPPKSLLTPIVGCQRNTICQFLVPAIDADGDDMRWRLSTPTEAGDAGFIQPGPPHSTFPLSIDANTGIVTWNTANAQVDPTKRFGYYSTQISIEDLDGFGAAKSRVAIDFFVEVFDPPPFAPEFDFPPTPDAGTVLQTIPNACLEFDLQASDADLADQVSIGDVAVPAGMLCAYDTPARTVTGRCEWEATAQQVSEEIVIFTATDSGGLSAPPLSLTLQVTDICQTAPPATPDPDGDGIGDFCDNCPTVNNPGQADMDFDTIGDACDTCAVKSACDGDRDGVYSGCDICPLNYNPGQEETDFDNVGDACDNCPNDANPSQTDTDSDRSGDACDTCPSVYNPGNGDTDADGAGDLCDNCPAISNPSQANSDGDTEGGDACDITITFPLEGDANCSSPPPTVTWSTQGFNRFRAYVSWNPFFSGTQKISSGDALLKTNSWTIPAKKWAKACTNANPVLYFRVYGKTAGTTQAGTSEPQPVTVK